MTSVDKWNFLVGHYNENRNAFEDVVQPAWEKIFSEIFGYKSIVGEIVSQPPFVLAEQTEVRLIYPSVKMRKICLL